MKMTRMQATYRVAEQLSYALGDPYLDCVHMILRIGSRFAGRYETWYFQPHFAVVRQFLRATETYGVYMIAMCGREGLIRYCVECGCAE